ncbi:hypothetical protein GPECTOR_22g928 [Gonium pectorale]|uniref:SET domain-containing protein n=1 Tax=Gonium pectorale TaxID=33097 RepID=A0A150GHN6_GONPE|nr:hypothetical protein GPECTOR_22g928 [Gonium pectorale]|eukprot:KXZ49334.1 hypothetical protein GPECTOR_22g928 [Gonium pectorale]
MLGQSSVRTKHGECLVKGEFIAIYSGEAFLGSDEQDKLLHLDPRQHWDDPHHPCPWPHRARHASECGRYAIEVRLPKSMAETLGTKVAGGGLYVTAARFGCPASLVNDPRVNIDAPHEDARYHDGGPNVAVVTAEVGGVLPVPLMVAIQDIPGGTHLKLDYGAGYWRVHADEQHAAEALDRAGELADAAAAQAHTERVQADAARAQAAAAMAAVNAAVAQVDAEKRARLEAEARLAVLEAQLAAAKAEQVIGGGGGAGGGPDGHVVPGCSGGAGSGGGEGAPRPTAGKLLARELKGRWARLSASGVRSAGAAREEADAEELQHAAELPGRRQRWAEALERAEEERWRVERESRKLTLSSPSELFSY